MTTSKQGRRATTIYSVAQLAGVSIATVSRVLQGTRPASPQTRANVLAAVKELDYVPLRAARSLAVRRHEAHGLVVPDLIGPYYSEMLMGYYAAAAQLGQSVVIVVTHPGEDTRLAVRDLSSRVDGLVLANSTICDDAVGTLGRRTPVVLLARPAVAGCDAVSAENVLSAAVVAHRPRSGATPRSSAGRDDHGREGRADSPGCRYRPPHSSTTTTAPWLSGSTLGKRLSGSVRTPPPVSQPRSP